MIRGAMMSKSQGKEKKFVMDWIDSHSADIFKLSDDIWNYSELGMEEYRTSKALVTCLKKNGFTVEEGVAGMPTAFVATYGSGKPIIAFNVEMDALPGLSQEKGLNIKNPVIEGAPGHGCGHNLLGPGAALAAISLSRVLAKFNLSGTVKAFGTPAEELCIGKPFMARAGLFNDVDVFLDWHPFFNNNTDYTTCNSYFSIRFHFKGRTAHGNSPWEGRSALDAAVLSGNMIEFLRENITPGNPPLAANTINYSFPDVGPAFPVVVPDRSTIWCVGRVVNSDEAKYVVDRLHKIAQASALATETGVEIELISATHERIPNKVISQVLHDNLQEIGPIKFTVAENNSAKKMQKDLGISETGINSRISPLNGGAHAVTDNSEFSWFAPISTLWLAIAPPGIGWHNWQVVSLAGSEIGKKAINVAAKILAASGIDLLLKPSILNRAKKELAERLQGRVYTSLIPEAVKPPVLINRGIMDQYRPLLEKHYRRPR